MGIAHEIADRIVNENGYSDDADESDRRSAERDRLELVIAETLKEHGVVNVEIEELGDLIALANSAEYRAKQYRIMASQPTEDPKVRKQFEILADSIDRGVRAVRNAAWQVAERS